MEIWKDIKDYEGLYQISNLGNVKSLQREKNNNGGKQLLEEKLLNPVITRLGYCRVGLHNKNGIKKVHLVHRLVAQTFIEKPSHLYEVNHIDGNKLNNHYTNLEWCDRGYNIQHSYKNGLRPTIQSLEKRVLELENEIKNIKANCYKVGE